MRFLGVLRAIWWLGVLAFAIYAGVAALAAYFRASDAVESAIDATMRWEKVQRPVAGAPVPSYVEAIRDEIVSKARKQGIPLNADRLRVSQVERSVSVQAWWAQPIVTVADETVVAVPLSLSRTFNIP
jgi:hypothetical protein